MNYLILISVMKMRVDDRPKIFDALTVLLSWPNIFHIETEYLLTFRLNDSNSSYHVPAKFYHRIRIFFFEFLMRIWVKYVNLCMILICSHFCKNISISNTFETYIFYMNVLCSFHVYSAMVKVHSLTWAFWNELLNLEYFKLKKKVILCLSGFLYCQVFYAAIRFFIWMG